jgi:flagellar M-ring protein FliF
MNAPFAAEKSDLNDVPLWRQPDVLDTARSFAWPLGMLALAAMVFFGVIRPAMKSLTQPMAKTGDGVTDVEGREGQLDALEADQPERPQLAGPGANEPALQSASELRLEDARKLTRDNPAAVANIVKAWINGEAPA